MIPSLSFPLELRTATALGAPELSRWSQVPPDLRFLGAVLVAVERGSAWQCAAELLEESVRPLPEFLGFRMINHD